jgi:DNA-binding SARP family transcriptional activator
MLLAVLLLNARRLVLADQLAEVLWGERPPRSARASLHNHVKRLRGALGEAGGRIRTEPGGYLAAVTAGELDAAQAQSLLATARNAGRAGDWEQASAQATAALLLWRGEPLAGISSDVLAREIQPLDEMRLQLTEIRLDAELALGRPAEVINELWRLAAAHPLRERLHALLMLALYRCGRRAEALAAYQAARKTLISELGSEPAPELQQLHRQILAGDPAPGPSPAAAPARPQQPGTGPGVPAAAPAPGSSGTEMMPGQLDGSAWEVRSSLPLDTAAFTGRDAELALLMSGVAEAGQAGGGMVAIRALSGMPGVGKTTLAVHAAHLLAAQYPDRRLFVDLHGHTPGREPVTASDALAGLLAATGADPRFLPPDVDGRAAMWRDRMAGQRALIVLDNAASGEQVAPLLPGTAGCLVIMTSRRYLADLPGAAVPVLVGPLTEAEAADMFIRLAPRAAADHPAQVAELTRLAGCLPLAVRLLAQVHGRHPTWTLADLATETRTRLLALAAENASVTAAFEVSRAHLDPARQEFLAFLGLHPAASFDAYASAALAGVPLDAAAVMLDGLNREGLLTEICYHRYSMHDLIRHYAAQRAETTMPAQDRQASMGRLLDYYQHTGALAGAQLATLHLAIQAPRPAPPLAAPSLENYQQAVTWLRAERSSLLACIDYAAAAGLPERVIALTAAISELLSHDGPLAQAIAQNQEAARAASSTGDGPGHAGALLSLAHAQFLAGNYQAARQAATSALAEFGGLGNRLGQASASIILADTHRMTGDNQAAAQLAQQALGVFQELGDQHGQAQALRITGRIRSLAGDSPAAVRLLEEALGICAELGHHNSQARILCLLAEARRLTGNYPAAAAAAQQALDLSSQLGDPRGQALALTSLGHTRRRTGDYPAAAAAAQRALDICRELGDRSGQASALGVLGGAQHASGNAPAATQAFEQALGIFRDIGNQGGQASMLTRLATALNDTEDGTAARYLGAALRIFRDIGDRGGQAAALNVLGTLHLVAGDLAVTADCHQQALELAREIGSPWDEAHALAGLGRCARAAGDLAAAAQALSQAYQIFRETGAAEAAEVGGEVGALASALGHRQPAAAPGS